MHIFAKFEVDILKKYDLQTVSEIVIFHSFNFLDILFHDFQNIKFCDSKVSPSILQVFDLMNGKSSPN